ncbi:hypothetical protein GIB67_030311 [Kingdonia uniflora]|uniref:Amino acid transporter transmembrane domain-containing protein n=1 Tax=Kingdonia uniflora TaxID=39325 RepID=A0A7J7M6S1_9MAGN|nr:hypothetical protein GIB67_030311 [Kingdonia uniflora]
MASLLIITAVIGSGVLSLSWAYAQLGWIVGPAITIGFSLITLGTSYMLCDTYRYPHPVTGTRTFTYTGVVEAYLGQGWRLWTCWIIQYFNPIGVTVVYAITASISMVAIIRSNCFHYHGHIVSCNTSNLRFFILFAMIQICLPQYGISTNYCGFPWLQQSCQLLTPQLASVSPQPKSQEIITR